MMRFLAIAICILVAACGGSSTAPSAPVAAATPTPVGPSPCTIAAPPASGWTWTRASFPGQITSLAIDETDGRTWVAANETAPPQVLVTNDAGVTWRPVLDGVVDFGGLRSGPAAIYAPVVRTTSGLNVSRDHGRSWSLILRPSGDVGYIQTVLPSRFSPGLLLAGAWRLPPGNLRPSSLFRSLDDGGTWTEVAYDDRLRFPNPPQFAEDGNGVILLAGRDPQSGGLYFRSTDAGATWQAVNGPLQNAFVFDLRSDTVRHRIYGFAGGFVSVTGDGGRSWSRFLGGPPTSPTALVVDERTGGVFAADSRPGRPGLYYLPDGANAFRPVALDGVDEIGALAMDRCGSILLAGVPGLLYSSPIPRNP